MEIPFNLLLSSKVEPTTVQATNRQRSEEHTSELQSQSNLVCRLLLEKKKQTFSNPSFQLILEKQASIAGRVAFEPEHTVRGRISDDARVSSCSRQVRQLTSRPHTTSY